MANKFKKEAQYKTRWYHRMPRYWLQKDLVRPEGVREFPEILRLDVEKGVKPCAKSPVRIFLGTEAGQYRAERVFVWSVMRVRDPSRVYEIYFMKDLKGYDRTGWKTGFTNYRYGIPAMGGGKGRAIYNDVDQIYLADPGEMFDLDMGPAGMLCITERETSVMLIDCEKMINNWTLTDAQRGKKHDYFRDAAHDHKLWGKLPGEWNARDDEYSAVKSKCFHFTTLQTQPWQPFPDILRYEPHPDGEVWFALERGADKAHFNVFTKDKPSHRYTEVLDQYRQLHSRGARNLNMPAAETFDGHSRRKHENDILALIEENGARTLLDYGAGKGIGYQSSELAAGRSAIRSNPAWPGVEVTCYDPGYEPFAKPYSGQFEGVICTDVLEHIPDEDIPWVIDELFKSAEKFVYASAACYPARKNLPNGTNAHVTQQKPEWWNGWFSIIARRYPAIRWRLCAIEKGSFGKSKRFFDGSVQLAKAA
jgi:hypothetical protein